LWTVTLHMERGTHSRTKAGRVF